LREIGQSLKASEKQAMSIEAVNKITGNTFDKRVSNKTEQRNCYSCGYSGHFKSDPKCPAKWKRCRRCKKDGHFEKCSKTKLTVRKPNQKRHEFVRNIEEKSSNSSIEENNAENVFTIHTRRSENKGFIIM
jgi:hypothetical protein